MKIQARHTCKQQRKRRSSQAQGHMLTFFRMTASAQSGRGLCYVVLIFNDVTQLLFCLWSIWDVRNTYILVVDEKSCSACKSLCEMFSERFENVTCVRGHNGSWGGYSLVSAVLSGMRAALSCSRNWQHLFLISGNHVALQDQDRIHSCLTVGKSYLTSEWIPKLPRPSEAEFGSLSANHQRIWGRWEEIPGIRMVMTGITARLPDVHFYKGSQWIALSRATCEALFEPQALALSHFFAHTFVADESFFHTTVRAVESPENVLWISTTYHGWHHGRAAYITEDQYRTAAQSGWWFGRKLPKSIGQSYADLIRRHCRALDLDSFINLINAPSSRGWTIRFKNDGVSVNTPRYSKGNNALLHSKYKKLICTLRKVAGAGAVVGQNRGDILDARIEPSALALGRSPVVGIVRSTDGKAAWLTIQLRAELFSDSVASLLLSSNTLRSVIDDSFEEMHLEPQFREFFRRRFRTAYLFDIDRIETAKSSSRLAKFFNLLAEAWACLKPGSSFDDSDGSRRALSKSSGTQRVKRSRSRQRR